MNETERQQRRVQLYELLGDLPSRNGPVNATILEHTERDDFSLETLVLDLNGIEAAPAYFVKPLSVEGRLPCILYNHAHGGDYELGKRELLNGRSALQSPPYAQAL